MNTPQKKLVVRVEEMNHPTMVYCIMVIRADKVNDPMRLVKVCASRERAESFIEFYKDEASKNDKERGFSLYYRCVEMHVDG